METMNEEGTTADVAPTESRLSKTSQTASDFIEEQLSLEADAREVLPYKFDSCTYALGPLRQNVFACLTCSPLPASPAQLYRPAGICYSCSISCHGEHNLVELFSRRNFVCDCGTTRMPSTSLCQLRSDDLTGSKGVHSQEAAKGNHYSHNFQNRFCACGEEYDVEKEKGIMFQCLGLGHVEDGGCGEDWWHPECLMGLPKESRKTEASHKPDSTAEAVDGNGDETDDDATVPPGFPREEEFESLICYKCVEANPWIKQYAGTPGFLPPVHKSASSQIQHDKDVSAMTLSDNPSSLKRKVSDDDKPDRTSSPFKRAKKDSIDMEIRASDANSTQTDAKPAHKHDSLPQAPDGTFSLFAKEDFREHFCHCPRCYPNLIPHPQLLEEEEMYEPPSSDSGGSDVPPGSGARSQATGSLLERGEAALSTIDRVRAIEGVMVYNHLKDKVKDFLKPYAESGRVVGAEDIKAYFEKLRGDDAAIRDARRHPADGDDKDSDNRREQSGY